jgi:putative peptidoglycan lipid II flippase
MSHLSRSTLIIAFFFGIDKVFGLARQILVGRQFGLSYDIDVFNAANNIPDLLSALISGGALGVALIPVLTEHIEKRTRRDAWELFSRILNLAFFVTLGLAIVLALVAEPLVSVLIAPGFPAEQQALTVELLRLDLLAIMVFSVSGLVMAGLQANQHFLFPAMAPVLYNVGQIFGVLILAPDGPTQLGPISLPGYGLGIHGLVYGVIFGALLHLGIQVPGLIQNKFHWIPKIGLRSPGVAQVLRLLGPRVLTMFFIQVFFITRDNLASGMGEGSVTALNYGWFLMQVPETLIGTALAIAILPTLAEYFARGDDKAFGETLNRAIRTLLALTIPAAALMAIGVRPLIGILGFDTAGTDLVVTATRAYLLGLSGHALLEIAARSFYARQDAVRPLFAAALNAALYIIFAITFSRLWGFVGIAIANSLAFTLEAALLHLILSRRVQGIWAVRGTVLRVVGAVISGSLGVLVITQFLPTDTGLVVGTLLGGLALVGGGLLVLPWIWPEVKGLVKL